MRLDRAVTAVLLLASCAPAAVPSSSGNARGESLEGSLAQGTRGADADAPESGRSKIAAEGELLVTWSRETRSPNPRAQTPARSGLEALCGMTDGRLDVAAGWLLARGPLGQSENDIDRLNFALRAAGTPYTRPIAWSRGWPENVPRPTEALELELRTWLSTVEVETPRRCGFAERLENGEHRLVVVAAQALAELTVPLPTVTRVGSWLNFEAELAVDATAARVLLVGPDGDPQQVPTSQTGRKVRSRFAAASPGRWLVQLLASTEVGPRPVLEAMLYVDVAPEPHFVDRPVPGETEAPPGAPPNVALELMVAGARRATGRPELLRDRALDVVALDHAMAMQRAAKVGHDVGAGSTKERLARAGLQARLAGENVVHAADPLRAHRALWASPSHRTNLLHRGFSRWGLGVTTGLDGSLWVCELFASSD